MSEKPNTNTETADAPSAEEATAAAPASPVAATNEADERDEYISLLESELESKVQEAEKVRAYYEQKLSELIDRERKVQEAEEKVESDFAERRSALEKELFEKKRAAEAAKAASKPKKQADLASVERADDDII